MLILFETKDTKILLCQVEHYTIKMDIIIYYLSTNTSVLKYKENCINIY